jgi:uncharacterized damage-inducible protein DinB
MASKILTDSFLAELRMETISTRKCLERVPESLFGFKPHEISMQMGYLVQLVAEIPLWIHHMIVDSVIDFKTYRHAKIETNAQLVAHFEDNLKKAEAALQSTDDEKLEEAFTLRNGENILYTTPKKIDIGTTLNHWVHHRGQLTVYMRMNALKIPSIYGPSADESPY